MTDTAATITAGKSTRDRLAEKKKVEKQEEPKFSVPQRIRGSLDALVVAYLLAMFIRSFVFELFMIPTGSMTPTLIGDNAGDVTFHDYDHDGIQDVIYTFSYGGGAYSDAVQVYLMNADGSYKEEIFVEGVERNVVESLARSSPRRTDMILVNKFSYWFSTPQRGDIAVFKVPDRSPRFPFDPMKPVYIKRVVGLPGETILIPPSNIQRFGAGDPNRRGNDFGGTEIHLQPKPVLANGEAVTEKRVTDIVHFAKPGNRRYPTPEDQDNIMEVPKDGVLMIGDNAASSSDGRYWGHVPLDNLRGRAVLRYMPFRQGGFLH